jgi:hypothetical protein
MELKRERVRERINKALVDHLSEGEPRPVGLWSVVYWMIGRSKHEARPTIVFCRSFGKSVRERARAIIKSCVELAHGIRVNSLNRGPQKQAGEKPTLGQTFPDDGNCTIYCTRDSLNPCGARITVQQRFGTPRPVTLGGIVLVEGKIRGITVDHAFREDLPLSASDDENDLSFDEDLGWETQEPNSLHGTSPCGLGVRESEAPEYPGPAELSAAVRRSGILESQDLSKRSRLGTLAYKMGKSLTSETKHDSYDWALIEIEDQGFMIANEVVISEADYRALWPQNIVRRPLTGRVWAVTGSGNIEGRILESTSYVQISSPAAVEMSVILLAQPLSEWNQFCIQSSSNTNKISRGW